jgi:NosR/NirI family transcriptional regulator, nitrous oxide reductase regulator
VRVNMKQIILTILLALVLMQSAAFAQAQQRFPKPEFENGYEQPDTTTPEPRSVSLEYFDVAVLLIVLILASWFALRKRSRRGILWLSVFTLLYFGFYRNGCICAIGSIQNVALTLADPGYAISITVLLFFILPLLFALFFGRTFCAGACPLGAIQDLIIIKPVSLPLWLRKTLGLIPYLYLGLAVLYAATGTDFIICRYDPFVSIFRMDGPFLMIALGIVMLLIGMFVARPYCRFFCPLSVPLNWMSRFSKWHLSITPKECIQCKLCSSSCPFDAINEPEDRKDDRGSLKQFLFYIVLVPLIAIGFGYAFSKAHSFLAKANSDVYLAELLIKHPEMKTNPDNLDIQTFMASGETMDELVESASKIQSKFYTGSWILGIFMGLVIAFTLLNQVMFRSRKDYEPDRGTCFSCGRCMDYCPVRKD